MEIEPKNKINWSQYVNSINHHKPIKIQFRDRPTAFNRHMSLHKKPSMKQIKDLSTTIDHSVMLYNKIKTTTSTSELSRIKLKNDMTTVSTIAHAYLPLTTQPSNFKPIYKTAINHSYTSSRNKFHTIYNDTLRVETLTQFKSKIRQERLNVIANKLSSDSLVKQYLTHGNIEESLDIQISSYMKNRDLLNLFMLSFKNYHKHIINEREIEQKLNSDLKERVNDLKVEIQKLNWKKSKLKQKMDTLFKMKYFLLCVKNQTTNIDDFSHKCLNEHKKDRDRQKLIEYDYKKICTTLIRKTKNNKNKKDLSSITIRRLERERIEFFPKKNEPVFNRVDDFLVIYDYSSRRFTQLINKQNDLKEECSLLKKEYDEVDILNKVNQNEVFVLNSTVSYHESKLTQVKGKNAELEALKQSILKLHSKTLKTVKEKIEEMSKEINAQFPMKLNNKPKEKSTSIIYLEAIEASINYLITREVEFKTKHYDAFRRFIKILKEQNKDNQAALMMKSKELKILEKIKRVYARKNKIIKIVKRKVAEKYNFSSTRRKINSTKDNKKNEYKAMKVCFNEYN